MTFIIAFVLIIQLYYVCVCLCTFLVDMRSHSPVSFLLCLYIHDVGMADNENKKKNHTPKPDSVQRHSAQLQIADVNYKITRLTNQ